MMHDPLEQQPDYYQLEPRSLRNTGDFLQTAAIMTCNLCGTWIDTMGGPGTGTICGKCGDALMSGQLVGCVIWEKSTDKSND